MRILCRSADGRRVVFGPLFHVSSEACAQHPQINVSMDGRGRAKDNIWIERFWKTIKYEYIYILPEKNGAALYSGIKRFIDNYNYHRRHQGIC